LDSGDWEYNGEQDEMKFECLGLMADQTLILTEELLTMNTMKKNIIKAYSYIVVSSTRTNPTTSAGPDY